MGDGGWVDNVCNALGGDLDHFAIIIVAARVAQVMRALEFAAVRALLRLHGDKRVVAAPHVAPRRRGFTLWDGH